jgi:hypothetical protein
MLGNNPDDWKRSQIELRAIDFGVDAKVRAP